MSSLPTYSSLASTSDPSSSSSTCTARWTLPDEIALIAFTPTPSTSSSSSPSPVLSPISSTKSSPKARLAHLLDSSEPKSSETKASISLALAESVCFTSPPTIGHRADGTPYVLSDGKGERLSGAVRVFLPSRRLVSAVKVKLVISERLLFPSVSAASWEDREVLKRELVYTADDRKGKKGFWMERGVHLFEFTFGIPPEAPAREVSTSGRVLSNVYASLGSAGGLLKAAKLEDKKEAFIVHRDAAFGDDPSALQFSYVNEIVDSIFGPRTLSLFSNTFTMAAPLHINLAFSCLPPSLTIFCISVSITQTTHLTSRYVSGKTATVVSPRRIIIQEGSRTGWTEKDFAERARRKGEGEGFVLDVDKEGNAGQFWRWRKLARMPIGDHLRPTTPPGVDSGLAFSSELTVEVTFQLGNGSVKKLDFYREPVNIASCCCIGDFLTLPDYSNEDASHRVLWNPPWEIGCMCDLKWQDIESREKKLLAQQEEEEAQSMMMRRLVLERNASSGRAGAKGREGEGGSGEAEGGERVKKVGEID